MPVFSFARSSPVSFAGTQSKSSIAPAGIDPACEDAATALVDATAAAPELDDAVVLELDDAAIVAPELNDAAALELDDAAIVAPELDAAAALELDDAATAVVDAALALEESSVTTSS